MRDIYSPTIYAPRGGLIEIRAAARAAPPGLMQNSPRAWSMLELYYARRGGVLYAARIIGYECHTRLTEARRASQSGQHGGVVQQGISSSKCSGDIQV